VLHHIELCVPQLQEARASVKNNKNSNMPIIWELNVVKECRAKKGGRQSRFAIWPVPFGLTSEYARKLNRGGGESRRSFTGTNLVTKVKLCRDAYLPLAPPERSRHTISGTV